MVENLIEKLEKLGHSWQRWQPHLKVGAEANDQGVEEAEGGRREGSKGIFLTLYDRIAKFPFRKLLPPPPTRRRRAPRSAMTRITSRRTSIPRLERRNSRNSEKKASIPTPIRCVHLRLVFQWKWYSPSLLSSECSLIKVIQTNLAWLRDLDRGVCLYRVHKRSWKFDVFRI